MKGTAKKAWGENSVSVVTKNNNAWSGERNSVAAVTNGIDNMNGKNYSERIRSPGTIFHPKTINDHKTNSNDRNGAKISSWQTSHVEEREPSQLHTQNDEDRRDDVSVFHSTSDRDGPPGTDNSSLDKRIRSRGNMTQKSQTTTVSKYNHVSSGRRRNNRSNPIEIELKDLGRKRLWKEMLQLYSKKQQQFNNFNYSTMMKELAYIRCTDKHDPLLLKFLDDLANQLELHGLEWLQANEGGTVVYSIAKMNLRANSATKIVNLIVSHEENANYLLQNGGPRYVSNACWACAKLRISAAALFNGIDQHPTQLLNEGNPQDISNIAWACAKLRIKLSRFFNELNNRHADWLVEEGNVQDVINTVYAFAILGIKPDKLLVNVERYAKWVAMEGDPQASSNAAWSFATLGVQAPKLFAEIDQRKAVALVEQGTTQAVANTAWASATLGIKMPNFFSIIEQNAKRLVNDGTTQAVGNIVWACAIHGFHSPNLFNEVERHATWLVTEGDPQSVSNTVWSFAQLEVESSNIFSEVEKNAERLVSLTNGATSQSISNTVWAAAQLGTKLPLFFAKVDQQAAWFVKSATAQCVANTVWASATMGIKLPKLLYEIEHKIEWLVEKGIPQDVATTASAFALLGHKSLVLLRAIEKNAKSIVSKATDPWDVVKIMSAFATTDIKSPKLCSEIERRAIWLLGEKQHSRMVSSVIYSFATQGFKSLPLCHEIENNAEWIVNKGSTHSISQIAWALATLQFKSPKLFYKMEEQATVDRFLKEGSHQDIANTLWAYSHMRYDTPRLFAAVESESNSMIINGNELDIANTVVAFANLGYDGTTYFTALEENIDSLLKNGNLRMLCNICYSLVVLDLCKKYKKLLLKVWEYLMAVCPDQFAQAGVQQLCHVEAYTKVDGIVLAKPSDSLRSRIDGAIFGVATTDSMGQSDISSLIRDIGFDHEEEVSPFDCNKSGGMLSIDMACWKRKIAIEYDGHYHFLLELPSGSISKRRDGPTKAKRRFLEKSGWKVLNLDWRDLLDKSKNQQIQFLKKELASVGIIV